MEFAACFLLQAAARAVVLLMSTPGAVWAAVRVTRRFYSIHMESDSVMASQGWNVNNVSKLALLVQAGRPDRFKITT
jgi:hypothetical protein